MNEVLLNSVVARLAESGAVNVILADCLWRVYVGVVVVVSNWHRSIGPVSWKRETRFACVVFALRFWMRIVRRVGFV